MWWLQLGGSIKSQVSVAEYRLFHRAILQQRPIIQSILLTKATPHAYQNNLQLVIPQRAANATASLEDESLVGSLT